MLRTSKPTLSELNTAKKSLPHPDPPAFAIVPLAGIGYDP
jgi:hypothetical protein